MAPVEGHSSRAVRCSRVVAHGQAVLRRGGLIESLGGMILLRNDESFGLE